MRLSRRSRLVLLAAAVVALVAVVGLWGARKVGSSDGQPVPTSSVRPRGVGSGFRDALAKGRARGAMIPFAPVPAEDGEVVIAGKVIDALSADPIGGVEVVFRSPAGEETTNAAADGTYRLRLPAGMYRAFVRDDVVFSVGRADHARLPGLPSADTAGVPDEALMPIILASSDADGVDLSVMRGGSLHVRVVDRGGRPIAGAVVRARSGVLRPTLGTDVAETDGTGQLEMRLPTGEYVLDATHPRFAGVSEPSQVSLRPGDKLEQVVTMTAGCVIAGRVVDPTGRATGDGAIEKQWGQTEHEFAPTGRIEADGTFRWVTTEEIEVTLRAWPWKAPPSAAKRFACKDGARFENIVFQLPDKRPDLDGLLVDDKGAPVPFAFIDLAPLDDGGVGQQERTDAQGRWQVFSVPTGRYNVAAHSPGHGVVSATVTSPSHDNKLALGGLGRIEGTTTLLANGSFELMEGSCIDMNAGAGGGVAMSQERRIVTVTGGRFEIDDVPACQLVGVASWRDQNTQFNVEVPAGGTAHLELALGPPRSKTVHGTVKDGANRPVAGATVSASYNGGRDVTVRTDAAGRFKLSTFSGAVVVANGSGMTAYGEVGMANVDDEDVDLVLEKNEVPPGYDEPEIND
jgi:hypothetical protein